MISPYPADKLQELGSKAFNGVKEKYQPVLRNNRGKVVRLQPSTGGLYLNKRTKPKASVYKKLVW